MRITYALLPVGVLLVTLAGCGGVAGEFGSPYGQSGTGAAAGGAVSFQQLDRNKDGKISKSEASQNRGVADQFASLDKDKDGNLSKSEFQSYQGATGGAAGGSTSK